MKPFVILILLAAAIITISSTAVASTGYSYLGAWQPPTIYQTNYWYAKTATFSGPYGATITTIQWQLQWNLNNGTYGIPSGLLRKICDAANYCTTITNPPCKWGHIVFCRGIGKPNVHFQVRDSGSAHRSNRTIHRLCF